MSWTGFAVNWREKELSVFPRVPWAAGKSCWDLHAGILPKSWKQSGLLLAFESLREICLGYPLVDLLELTFPCSEGHGENHFY